MTATRRLAAILAADVAGYSRLMGADEEGTLDRLKAHRRELVDPKIEEHHGRIFKTTGDGLLAEFPSVVDAVRCAVQIQRGMIDSSSELSEDRRITFRIGINLGDVIIDGDDVYGDGVNIAAWLEALAEPSGVCISRAVRNQIRDKLPYAFEDMGEQNVKNIARPLHAYAISAGTVALTPLRAAQAQPRQPSRGSGLRRARVLAVMLALIALGSAVKPARKGALGNPRLFFVHLWLAAPLALRDELDEARSALAQSLKLRPEINSLARWRSEYPWYANPQFVALAEPTLYAGLRRADFPEE